MELNGHVQGGIIVLETDRVFPEGTEVTVILEDDPNYLPTLAERFKTISGKANDLPHDLAEHHDQYLHGGKV